MAYSKKRLIKYLQAIIIYTFFAIFSFGQLIRRDIRFLGTEFALHPVDLLAGVSIMVLLASREKLSILSTQVFSFFAACIFSLLLSMTIFSPTQVLIGSLFLVRLIAYYALFELSVILVKTKKIKKTITNLLISVSTVSAIFGWVQYLFFPDLRVLKYIGWDEHLYRLVGTFLDPGFTGIILVLGFILSINKYLEKKDIKQIFVSVFLLLSVAFTYSRASYLALMVALATILIIYKKIKYILIIGLIVGLMVLLLPRPEGEGVRLERVQSIYQKMQNYSQTAIIIKKHPLFGIGFNNMCNARIKYFNDVGYRSHACSGSDSSLLLVFATTGAVGLMIFIRLAIKVLKVIKKDYYGKTFLGSAAAIFTHSLFVNSLFYPWILGWMAILLAVSLKERSGE